MSLGRAGAKRKCKCGLFVERGAGKTGCSRCDEGGDGSAVCGKSGGESKRDVLYRWHTVYRILPAGKLRDTVTVETPFNPCNLQSEAWPRAYGRRGGIVRRVEALLHPAHDVYSQSLTRKVRWQAQTHSNAGSRRRTTGETHDRHRHEGAVEPCRATISSNRIVDTYCVCCTLPGAGIFRRRLRKHAASRR